MGTLKPVSIGDAACASGCALKSPAGPDYCLALARSFFDFERMKCLCAFLPPVVGLALLICAPARAEQHRATRLGSPSTRFAPPLATPEDLRSRFRDEKLKPDIASILRQWGWTGDLDDLHRAALTAEIADVKIPVGTIMPFMSSREGGRPICLRNVIWAGKEPAPAYAFHFVSNERRYRCVTPKACSNFFLEDLGLEPKPALALDCAAPAEVLVGRPVEVCLNVRNPGTAAEAKTTVALTIPQGATLTRMTEGGSSSEGLVTWEIPNLAVNAAKQLCAVLTTRQTGALSFNSTATGVTAKPAQTSCATKIRGVPAILLDAIDLEDPVEVGHEVTYVINLTNQGSENLTNIRMVCTLPDSQKYVSGTGVTAVQAQDRTITMEPLPTLAPKALVTWRVVVKALKADDARFKLTVSTDQFERPIPEEESTRQY